MIPIVVATHVGCSSISIRSAEIAASILQRKELGCSRARRVSTIEEERAFGSSR